MSKDPTPRADALQAMREQRYGHLQATAEPAKLIEQAKSLDYGKSSTAAMLGMAAVELEKAERLAELRKAAEQKCRPYAGKISKGEADRKMKAPRKPRKPKGTKA